MRVAIMQPTYLPWLGYFDLIDSVDLFVFYDCVQYTRRSWQSRNRINNRGSHLYLTLPIKKDISRQDLTISKACIESPCYTFNQHLKTIHNIYGAHPYFKAVFPLLEDVYSQQTESLSTINSSLIIRLAQYVGIKAKFVFSSTLNNIHGHKDERLTSICDALNASSYLSPLSSSTYIEKDSPGGQLTSSLGLPVLYQNYLPASYPQRGSQFLPFCSIIDLLFNVSPSEAYAVIVKGRLPSFTSYSLPKEHDA